MYSFDPDNSATTGTVIRGNIVRNAGNDGLRGHRTDNPIPNTRIEYNHVSRSADDGIDVARAGTLVAGNIGDLGVRALPDVIDGGGNHAFRNGNSVQ